MDAADHIETTHPLNEMAIVDTFTKLIFGEDRSFSSTEDLIIQALRVVDSSVVFDNYKDMGIYLRALGVSEMIQLVSRVQDCLASGVPALVETSREKAADHRAH